MIRLNNLTKDHLVNLYCNEKKSLEDLGMPKRTIYKQKTKNGWSYMFVYGHKDSIKLFDFLYKNAQNSLFLDRKYKRFLEGLREL